MTLATLAVDATYALWGKAATYTPPAGSPVACTVLKEFRDGVPNEFTSKPPVRGWVIRVRAAEVAAPTNQGVFAIGATQYAVTGAPAIEDPDGLEWICAVA